MSIKQKRNIPTQQQINEIIESGGDFSNCDFYCDVIFDNRTLQKKINFNETTFRRGVSFVNTKFECDVSFNDAVFVENGRFWSAEFKEKATFINTRFQKLADFYDAEFYKSADFFKTDFKGTAVFTNAIFNDNVLFTFSLLNNMIFRQASFNKGLDLSLVANIDWNGNFFDIPHNFQVLENQEIPFNRQRETFRIIKNQLIKQNNKIEALYYHGLEMKAYKAEIISKDNASEKFLLWLNRSNDYGLNWIKPALLAIGFTVVFYLLIAVSFSKDIAFMPPTSFLDIKDTFVIWWEYKKMIPQLLNPAHSMDALFGINTYISGYTYTLDYLLRLILAYFIYQTISAFRKHSK